MSQKNKGVCCILLSSFSFALMNLFVHLSGDLPSVQKSFFRNFVAMLFALFILLKERPTIRLDGASKKYLFLRSFCGTVGILCNFYAVDHLVLADASMLNKMSPFFAILFGILILKERINLFQGLCVVAAFIGTLFVIKPTPSNLACFPALIGLLGGLGAGIAYTCVRALGMKGVKGSFIVFFFSAFSCVVTLPYLIFRYHPMTLQQLGILLLAGLAAAGGQFTITAAYTYAPAREISGTVDGKTTTTITPAYYLYNANKYVVVDDSCADTKIVKDGKIVAMAMLTTATDVKTSDTVTATIKGVKDAKCGQYEGEDDTFYVIDGKTYKADSKGTGFALLNGKVVVYNTTEAMAVAHDLDTSKVTSDKGTVTAIYCKNCQKYVPVVKSIPATSVDTYKSVVVGTTTYYYLDKPVDGTSTGTSTTTKPSPKTFDAGIAMYVGMALTSVAGSAVVIGKKKEF